MKDVELEQLWKRQDHQLGQLLSLNQEQLMQLTRKKAGAALKKSKPSKYLGILLGVPWILLLDALSVIGYRSGGLFFTVSVVMISLCTKLALGTYVYHLLLIRQINHEQTVYAMQEKIAKIKSSTFKMLRIIVLQLPFWTTLHWSMQMLHAPEFLYWFVNLCVTTAFAYLAYWLYKNIKAQNTDKRWVKWLFSDREWTALMKAEDILQQIQDSQ